MDAQRWIVGLRRRCVSVQAIASVVGMHPLKVRAVLKAAGVVSLGEAEVRLIGRLYQDEGCSIEELAAAAGVDGSTVFKALARAGVPRRRQGRPLGVPLTRAPLSPDPALRRRIQEARAA
jgi:hypothetical protein